MTWFRFRIGHLMALVGVVAVHIQVVRALLAGHGPEIRLGGALLWIALAAGSLLASRARGRGRSFWLGFVGCGAIAWASFLAAEASPDSLAGRTWMRYHVRAEGLWWPLAEATFRRFGHPAVQSGVYMTLLTMSWILPMFVAALAGGLVARGVGGGPGRRDDPPGDPIASRRAGATP